MRGPHRHRFVVGLLSCSATPASPPRPWHSRSRASDRHPAVGGRRQIEGRRGVLDDDATPLCPAHPAAHSIVFMANSITCEAHPIMQSMGLPPRRAASGSAGSPVPSATASTRLIRRAASSGLVAAAA
ncbi:hypothetical protein U9M48_032352 [Paspalum notatum var. saurae]|uniref:Uncharacterized protein n=1 Tax=Paspalum notatum var. saurae TaxID=547442 RepID=A0AAQ3X5N1_PASNO